MNFYNQKMGYACINMTLGEMGIMTNRHAIQRTFLSKGLPHISKLCLANVTDLEKIIHWNEENKIKYYRISSSMFPWMTEYSFDDLPDWSDIQKILKRIGEYVTRVNQRLEFHPSHFTILASPNENTVKRSMIDLEQHSRIFDEMGLKPSYWNCLNIHIGGVYGNKQIASEKWCENFSKLSKNCQERLVVENDDKSNMYSVNDLHNLIYKNTKTPITFDAFHHNFCTGNLTFEEAAKLAASTWNEIDPVIHWSSSMKNNENPEVKEVAHANYIYDKINDWNTNAWFMCESKAKELSILDYWHNGPRT